MMHLQMGLENIKDRLAGTHDYNILLKKDEINRVSPL